MKSVHNAVAVIGLAVLTWQVEQSLFAPQLPPEPTERAALAVNYLAGSLDQRYSLQTLPDFVHQFLMSVTQMQEATFADLQTPHHPFVSNPPTIANLSRLQLLKAGRVGDLFMIVYGQGAAATSVTVLVMQTQDQKIEQAWAYQVPRGRVLTANQIQTALKRQSRCWMTLLPLVIAPAENPACRLGAI